VGLAKQVAIESDKELYLEERLERFESIEVRFFFTSD
jgi:hypothetical protein